MLSVATSTSQFFIDFFLCWRWRQVVPRSSNLYAVCDTNDKINFYFRVSMFFMLAARNFLKVSFCCFNDVLHFSCLALSTSLEHSFLDIHKSHKNRLHVGRLVASEVPMKKNNNSIQKDLTQLNTIRNFSSSNLWMKRKNFLFCCVFFCLFLINVYLNLNFLWISRQTQISSKCWTQLKSYTEKTIDFLRISFNSKG